MLNKSDILRVTNQGLDIFKYYLNNQVIRLGRNFLNPLYEELERIQNDPDLGHLIKKG